MVTIMDKKLILDLKRKGISNRKAASILCIDRKTVAKYWNEYNQLQKKIKLETNQIVKSELQEKISGPPKYNIQSRKTKVLTPAFYQALNNILEMEAEKEKLLGWKKQNKTKRQIHSNLKEMGFKVGYSTVCAEINRLRGLNKECYIKQQYNYGDRLEYDFGEVHLFIDGKPKKYYMAIFSSPASNFKWSFLYDNQKMLVFLDSHVKFFEMTKHVWNEVVYDNMRNVVKKFLGKNEKELNEELIKLSIYYGFKINVTNAYKGNEKGHVENSVKNLRNLIFADKVEFNNFNDAEKYMYSKLFIINSKSKIISELSVLKPAAPKYEIARITTSKVDKYSFIQVENNKYSVPEYLVGYNVTTKIYYNKILIYCNDEFVCCHKKLKGKGQFSVDIKHYLKTLLKKPGAIQNSLALKSNPKLHHIYTKYYIENSKKFIEIIELNKTLNWEKIIIKLIENAKQNTFKYKYFSIKHNIPIQNQLSIQTRKIVDNYNNLIIKGGY